VTLGVLGDWPRSAELTLRAGYGVLLLLQLAMTWPQARRFFVSERHGGYMESSPLRDRLLTPLTARILMVVWLGAALGMIAGRAVLVAVLVNVILARYFFVQTRWTSILRGMGAPGHMNYWLASLVALLAISESIDRTGLLRTTTVAVFRVDYACIMFMAGMYKLSAGYASGEGFERGLVNPWWGFWAATLRRVPPRWLGFRLLNHLGWSTEVVCSLLFLVPSVGPWAAAFFGASFLVIGTNIRLTFLAETVALCCLLFVRPGSWFDRLLVSREVPLVETSTAADALALGLTCILGAYLLLLPLSYAGMSYNFYAKRRLPPLLQRMLDAWARVCGLVLWRVFTSDVIDFYCDITIRSPTGSCMLYYSSDRRSSKYRLRYTHVGEFICLASIFTALKYYPNNTSMFESRILRYARTLPVPAGGDVVFDYHRIEKGPAAFGFPIVARFTVDPVSRTVTEQVLNPSHSLRSASPASPVFAGTKPGSYAPR
jgi:hypothetical protein